MAIFQLIAYEKKNGEVPVEEFLDSINPKMRVRQKKKVICSENLIVSIWMMVFMNCVANLEVMLLEYYTFSIMMERL